MAASSLEEVKKHSKIYWIAGSTLLVLTAFTVYVSYFEVAVGLAVLIALLIAFVKGSLVAGYFMHLKAEKKFIYLVLGFTVIFFLLLIAFPLVDYLDNAGVANVP